MTVLNFEDMKSVAGGCCAPCPPAPHCAPHAPPAPPKPMGPKSCETSKFGCC